MPPLPYSSLTQETIAVEPISKQVTLRSDSRVGSSSKGRHQLEDNFVSHVPQISLIIWQRLLCMVFNLLHTFGRISQSGSCAEVMSHSKIEVHLEEGLSLNASYKMHSDCTALKLPTGTGSDTLDSLKSSTRSTYLENKFRWKSMCSLSSPNLARKEAIIHPPLAVGRNAPSGHVW